MKTKWTKRLLSGFLSLMMLVCLIPTSALAVENKALPEYVTPIYPETSEEVTVEATLDSETKTINMTVTIDENADAEQLDVNLTDAIGQAFQNASNIMPGASYQFNLKLVNNSQESYDYEGKSMVLGTVEYTGEDAADKEAVETFEGFHVYLGSSNDMYRMRNVPLEALGVTTSNETTLSDEYIRDLLTKAGYNGIDGLDDYYVSYYNQHNDPDIATLSEAPMSYLQSLYKGRGTAYETIKEMNPEVAAMGYYYFYEHLLTLNGHSLASYMEKDSTSYAELDSKLAESIALQAGESVDMQTVSANLSGPDTTNTFADYSITYGFAFSLEKGEPKTSYPALEKFIVTDDGDIKNDTAAAGDEIKFKLESTVPEDLLNYLNPDPVDPPEINGEPQGDATEGDVPEGRGEYQLTFHDQMDDAFINPDGFEVKIGDTPLTEGQYTLTQTDLADSCDFEITIDLVALYGSVIDQDDLGVTPITVTYTATLSEGTTAGQYKNTSWVSYPTDDSEESVVTVDTYGIRIFKYDQAKGVDAEDAGLAGAEFKLYDKNAVDENGDLKPDAQPILDKTFVSGDNGYVRIDGLDEGIYYLVETKAPTDYVKSDTPLKITIAEDVDSETHLVDVSFANSPIPHTGGMGTTLFSIVGGVLIAMAGTIFVISRRKRRA